MSEELDKQFNQLLPEIEVLEAAYENIPAEDPIERGYVGRDLLNLVRAHGVATEYLRHCERQIEADLTEPKRGRVELIVRILSSPV